MSVNWPKIITLTDLHFTSAGEQIIGLDTAARFQQTLTHALTHQSDAVAIILMGDLTHHGTADQYARLAKVIMPLDIPVIPMLGNHDRRDMFLAAFPDTDVTPSGHVQTVVDLPTHRIITLDTYDENADPLHSGWMCGARLAWLDQALADAEGRMPLVFTHHPPHAVGLPGMDAIALRNGDDLLARLAGSGAHLFSGHVHRTISGQAQGVPFSMFKSPCHQAPLDLVHLDSTLSVAEPGAYGLLLLGAQGVIAHSEDVGLGSVPVSGNDALPEGGTFPSVIEWRTDPLPPRAMPDAGLDLLRLDIGHPEPARLSGRLDPLFSDPRVVVAAAPAQSLAALVATPDGPKWLR